MDQNVVFIACGTDFHGPAQPDSIKASAIQAPTTVAGILIVDIDEDIL